MSFKIQLVLKVIACPASLQYIECPWNAEPLDCPRVCTNRAFSEFHGMWVLFACLLFNQVLSKTDFPMHFTSANWKWKRFALKRRHLFISGEMLSFSGLPFLVSWKVKFYQNQTNSVLIFRVFHNLTIQEWCFYEKMQFSCIHSKSSYFFHSLTSFFHFVPA